MVNWASGVLIYKVLEMFSHWHKTRNGNFTERLVNNLTKCQALQASLLESHLSLIDGRGLGGGLGEELSLPKPEQQPQTASQRGRCAEARAGTGGRQEPVRIEPSL